MTPHAPLTDDELAAPVCGPCSLDVHDDCHRHDGDECGCIGTPTCGAALRVFSGMTPNAPLTDEELAALVILLRTYKMHEAAALVEKQDNAFRASQAEVERLRTELDELMNWLMTA